MRAALLLLLCGCADPIVSGLPDRDGDGDGWGVFAFPVEGCDQPSGYVAVAGDCAPSDPTRHPEAPEQCDEIDQDCDDLIDEDFDQDGDGYLAETCAWIAADEADCDDINPDVHPLGAET